MVPVAAEAFSRLLGQSGLTAADLGWAGQDAAAPRDPWRGDPVAWITSLGKDDMLNRRTLLTAGLYSPAAATLPSAPEQAASRTGPARRAGLSDVARIREMGDRFQEMDDLYGGGHGRATVAAYLVQEAAPLLRGTAGKARPALFTAAAEMACLLAWMSADDARPGLAQRYCIQAIRLADEAGSPAMRATALRSLSVQAIELGHHQQGHALADAASTSARGAGPRRRAWITGMQAESSAAHGQDRHRARRLLAQAEADLEHADSPPEHDRTGNYRRESFEHQAGLTLAQLGDWTGAAGHYALSVAARRPSEHRTRALIGAGLARIQVIQRRPDEAARTLLNLRDDLTTVTSTRLAHALATVRTGWRPYRPDPLIDDADRLLVTLTRAEPASIALLSLREAHPAVVAKPTHGNPTLRSPSGGAARVPGPGRRRGYLSRGDRALEVTGSRRRPGPSRRRACRCPGGCGRRRGPRRTGRRLRCRWCRCRAVPGLSRYLPCWTVSSCPAHTPGGDASRGLTNHARHAPPCSR